jgi:hypothetical protein
MKNAIVACATLFLFSTAAMSEEPKAASAPPPAILGTLTDADIQVIAIALNEDASHCSDSQVACKVGLLKTDILAKLAAAEQAAAAKSKK